MARLMAVANGNNTDASTWQVIDNTSFIESETSGFTVPTTYATNYSPSAPGAITVDGIGVRLSTRSGSVGTFSVQLYNVTLGAAVAGTEVTINCSDFVDGSSTYVDGGWYFFKWSSSVLLLAANNYAIQLKTSNANQITVYGATTTNPSKFLRTTTTQAPAAGDDRFVMGEWTAAGTTTTKTVTLNDTSTVDYGAASTLAVNPALSISAGGIVLAGTTASTTYVQKTSGNVVVYNGGVLRLATSGSRMPTSSSFTWTIDCVANVDFGILVRRKGEFTAYGASKQRWTTLTADKAASATVIALTATTGWANGDTLCFAPTGTTVTQGESKTISTVDSSTQVTLSSGLTNAHTGTGDVIGEVGNLTSNVKIVGTSQTVCTFISFADSSLGVLDNVEVQYYGSATAGKKGIEASHMNTSTNSMTLNSCSFRDPFASTSVVVGANVSAAGAFVYLTNNVIYNNGGTTCTGITFAGGSTGTPTFDVSANLIVGTASGGTGLSVLAVTGTGGTITNNRIAGFTTGLNITTTFVQDTVTNLSGFKIHSCSTGVGTSSTQNKTLTSFEIISNTTGVSGQTAIFNLTSCSIIGNSSGGVTLILGTSTQSTVITLTSCTFRGRTSFAQPNGLVLSSGYGTPSKLIVNDCSFGATTAHTTSDVAVSGIQGVTAQFNNCTFASTTEFSSTTYTFLDQNASIGIQRLDTTAGNHKTFIRQGIVTPDATIYKTASPSMRVTPKSASIDCDTHLFPFRVAVNSGQTCTPTVYVRESEAGDGAAYNGSRAKLYVKANWNLGITSDTLLDTATASSDGAWEGLTGTTSAVTDSGVLEFYVVLNGTTGWLNIDDASATVA